VFECEDAEKAFAEMVENEDCKRWNAITSKMIDKQLEAGDVSSGVDYLREVFYLK
jgi:L-rhamnose mutarotase